MAGYPVAIHIHDSKEILARYTIEYRTPHPRFKVFHTIQTFKQMGLVRLITYTFRLSLVQSGRDLFG